MQRKYRLTHRSAFTYIYKHGKAASNANLTLIYNPTKYGKRFGFSISHKVGKAVVRNKLKRRLKNGLMPYIDSISKGYNYIFVVKPPAAQLDFNALIDSALSLLKRAKLLDKTV